jgi:hypothetical protein
MMAAALLIIVARYYDLRAIERKYFGTDYNPDALELLSRMSLDDLLRYRQYVIDMWLAVCMLTMSRLFNV